MMLPQLHSLYHSLEDHRRLTLESLQHLSTEQLNTHPIAGQWSMSQVLAHLVTSEQITNQYLRKKLLGLRDAADTGWWEEVKFFLLQVSQRLPLKYKAPKAVVERTAVFPDLPAIEHAWDESRAELRSLLEQFQPTDLKKKIYRHIIAGRLNILHGLHFVKAHLDHHQPQINRLLHHLGTAGPK